MTPSPSRPAEARRGHSCDRATLALTGGFWSFLAFSYLKGFNGGLQVWGRFYWYVDYSAGFIRRGLWGAVVAPLRSVLLPRGTDIYERAVVAIYHGAALTLLAAMGFVAARRLAACPGRARALGAVAFVVFLLSPVVPILAYNTGYLDVFGMVLALTGGFAVLHGRHLAAATLGVCAVLLNEGMIFLWLPVMILAVSEAWRGRRAAALWPIAAPLLALVALVMLEDRSAAARLIGPLAAFDPDTKQALITQQYGQTAMAQFRNQVARIATHPLAFGISLGVTQLATLVICLLTMALQSMRGGRLWATGSPLWPLAFCFSPLGTMLLAWDLSRLMSWTNFAAGSLVLLTLSAPELDR